MKNIQLFQAVGEIDDNLLSDTEQFLNASPAVRRPRPWVKWGSLAACAAVAVGAMWAARVWTPEHTADPIASEEVLPSASQPAPEITQGEPTVDAPAVDPEQITQPVVEMNFNRLDGEPDMGVYSMFALMWEDFVPMTREELLDYFGVSLPLEEILPDFFAVEPYTGFGRGIYRRDGGDGDVYFDGASFGFESADGVCGVYVSLDKVFHMPTAPWELPGERLEFTTINGWELALFCYPDEEGNQYFRTEFQQNGVKYIVTGKNMVEQQYAAVLGVLLEERGDHAPGEVRTFRGTYGGGLSHQFLTTRNPDGSTAVEESWRGPLLLDLEDGGEYTGLNIELTPEQAEALSGLELGDPIEVSFTGEPATVGTVWAQQLVSLEKLER